MKMMGTARLKSLALSGDQDLQASANALIAELEHGEWIDASEVRSYYPQAEIEGPHVTIRLDAGNCVVLAIDYVTKIVLIQSAGPCTPAGKLVRKRSGKTS